MCAAKVDVFLDAWVDMHDKTNGLALKMVNGGCTQEEALGELDKIIENVHVPALKFLENQLTQDGGPYIAGEKLTIADCAAVALLANVWENPAGPWTAKFEPVLKGFPAVQAYNLAIREAFKERLGDPARKPLPL